jgi:hypothetical protein
MRGAPDPPFCDLQKAGKAATADSLMNLKHSRQNISGPVHSFVTDPGEFVSTH